MGTPRFAQDRRSGRLCHGCFKTAGGNAASWGQRPVIRPARGNAPGNDHARRFVRPNGPTIRPPPHRRTVGPLGRRSITQINPHSRGRVPRPSAWAGRTKVPSGRNDGKPSSLAPPPSQTTYSNPGRWIIKSDGGTDGGGQKDRGQKDEEERGCRRPLGRAGQGRIVVGAKLRAGLGGGRTE